MSAIEPAQFTFSHSWSSGISGDVVTNPFGKSVWKDPQADPDWDIDTLNKSKEVLQNGIMRNDFDGTNGGLFFAKNEDGKVYLPSIECLDNVGIQSPVQYTFSWCSDKPASNLSLEEFKQMFVNILLSIIGCDLNETVYDGILSLEIRQRIGRNGYSDKQVKIWTKRDVDEKALTREIDNIVNCQARKPDFYFPNALNYKIQSKCK